MKIITYNVNGIRSAISKGFIEWLQAANPDMICLQELKAEEHQIEKQLLTDELEAIELKLNDFFNSSTLLFNSSFNINRLATEIGVPSNVLTKYFNQFLGMRYNHAINKIRIEKLLEMVESDNNILKHITMEAIGNKIGFSSKSSFYAAFSREMGCTPAEYFSRKHE